MRRNCRNGDDAVVAGDGRTRARSRVRAFPTQHDLEGREETRKPSPSTIGGEFSSPSSDCFSITVKRVGLGDDPYLTLTDLDPSTTVGELKQLIYSDATNRNVAASASTQPVSPQRQRLIFSGRMLTGNDDVLVSDINMKTDETNFVHLVPLPEGKGLSIRGRDENRRNARRNSLSEPPRSSESSRFPAPSRSIAQPQSRLRRERRASRAASALAAPYPHLDSVRALIGAQRPAATAHAHAANPSAVPLSTASLLYPHYLGQAPLPTAPLTESTLTTADILRAHQQASASPYDALRYAASAPIANISTASSPLNHAATVVSVAYPASTAAANTAAGQLSSTPLDTSLLGSLLRQNQAPQPRPVALNDPLQTLVANLGRNTVSVEQLNQAALRAREHANSYTILTPSLLQLVESLEAEARIALGNNHSAHSRQQQDQLVLDLSLTIDDLTRVAQDATSLVESLCPLRSSLALSALSEGNFSGAVSYPAPQPPVAGSATLLAASLPTLQNASTANSDLAGDTLRALLRLPL
uniref:Ubiquitin-like domain-containing protein n=1 Tax=Odontella aurita TaxID=265563 RepID=A0A7S4JIT7_9STRA